MDDFPALVIAIFALISGICWYVGSYNAAVIFCGLALFMLVLRALVKRDL